MRAIEGQPGSQVVMISGPSGVGKDSIVEALKHREPPHPREFVVGVTTRLRREHESDGVDYHFLSVEDFTRLQAGDRLLEACPMFGHWYGIPRDEVRSALTSGRDAILKLDVEGAEKVLTKVPEALLIFVVPPSLEALEARLVTRSSETPSEIERRQRSAATQLARQGDHDHVAVNRTGELERAAEAIDAIIAAEHGRYPKRRIKV